VPNMHAIDAGHALSSLHGTSGGGFGL